MNLIKKLNYSIKWNAIEGIYYKALLAAHQTFLFYIASKFIYGLTSVIFALIYLTVELINLGLDRSLAQLSKEYLNSKTTFKRFLAPQLIIQLILLVVVLIALITNYTFAGVCFSKQFGCAFLSKTQWLLISTIIISEALRKTLRIASQLLFLNKQAAILESFLITLYVGIFWVSIFMGYNIGIYTIYIPLLIQSLIGTGTLVCLIIPKLFRESSNKNKSQLNWPKIIKLRTQNYLYQISDMFFSGNFLISFLGSKIGINNIGPLKLANYIAVFIKAILQRTLGLSSLSVLAYSKDSSAQQSNIFNIAQNRLQYTLYILSMLFIIFASISDITTPAMLFFGFTLINNYLIVYEQYFIVKNRILILFALNIISAFCFYLINLLMPQANVFYILIPLILIRIISVLIARRITKYI